MIYCVGNAFNVATVVSSKIHYSNRYFRLSFINNFPCYLFQLNNVTHLNWIQLSIFHQIPYSSFFQQKQSSVHKVTLSIFLLDFQTTSCEGLVMEATVFNISFDTWNKIPRQYHWLGNSSDFPAVKEYTGKIFQQLNLNLRNNPVSTQFQNMTLCATSAINRLKEGEVVYKTIIYCGNVNDKTFINQNHWSVGDSFVWPAFWRTSKNLERLCI